MPARSLFCRLFIVHLSDCVLGAQIVPLSAPFIPIFPCTADWGDLWFFWAHAHSIPSHNVFEWWKQVLFEICSKRWTKLYRIPYDRDSLQFILISMHTVRWLAKEEKYVFRYARWTLPFSSESTTAQNDLWYCWRARAYKYVRVCVTELRD